MMAFPLFAALGPAEFCAKFWKLCERLLLIVRAIFASSD